MSLRGLRIYSQLSGVELITVFQMQPRIQSFTMLYKNMVRSHLDYCSSVWSPKDIEALEKVQKRATKILPQLKHMNYSDRLKACKLYLHYTDY